MEETNELDLRSYLNILKRWWWLLVIVTALAAVISFLVSTFLIERVYEARTILLIQTPDTQTSDYTSLITSEKLANTYSQLMTTRPVLVDVINRLNLKKTVEGLRNSITIRPIPNTQLIEVKIRNSDPGMAAQIANTLASVYVEQHQAMQAYRFKESKQRITNQLAQLDQQSKDTKTMLDTVSSNPDKQVEKDILQVLLGQYRQNYTNLMQIYEEIQLTEASATASIIQMENAYPPEKPVSPRVSMNTILAAVVVFVLVMGTIVLFESLDNTIKKSEQVTLKLHLPVLGSITGHSFEPGKPVTITQPRASVAEAFRTLRTNIQFANVDSPIGSLLITSPMLGDGKSTVASNLAIVMAQSGQQVILIDADLRRPRLHAIFALKNRPGLSRMFVQQDVPLSEALQATEVPGLSVLTAGYLPPNPLELVGSDRMNMILHQAQEQADIVLIDAPPVSAVSDAAVLAKRMDGVLLVISVGKTQIDASQETLDQLNRAGTKIIGVVLNDKKAKKSRYYYY